MLEDFLVVHKSVLPEVYEKVIEVKMGLDDGTFSQISEAIKVVGISRSAFYKYKDHVFVPESTQLQRKALLSFVLSHKTGLLSSVLGIFSKFKCNVLTINQNIPIQQKASVVVSLDIASMNGELKNLIEHIENVSGVSKVTLLSVE